MEGVKMRGADRRAVAVRVPDGRIHIRTQPLKPAGKWSKIPVVRGVFAFVSSLVTGMKTLLYSADVLEAYGWADGGEEGGDGEPGAFEKWLTKRFGEKAVWNLMIYLAVIAAIAVTVAVFILLPTLVVSLLSKVTESKFLLNLAEGVLRIIIFVAYIAAVSRMEDIKTTFMYHGTSFLMFVMVISLILFSLLGWPNLAARLISRIVLIPVVAGLSYELLKWAGRSDNIVVRVLSLPGLALQMLTTRPPTDEQVEVAICSMKAVLVPEDAPYIEGICDKDANLIEEKHVGSEPEEPESSEK